MAVHSLLYNIPSIDEYERLFVDTIIFFNELSGNAPIENPQELPSRSISFKLFGIDNSSTVVPLLKSPAIYSVPSSSLYTNCSLLFLLSSIAVTS